MNLLLLFIILNVVNVVVQTFKSIATIKYGKLPAAIVNAVAYGLYTIVLVYMTCDLELWAKVVIVATANFVGVYIVKLLEEKTRKDRLWKIEATVKKHEFLSNQGMFDSITVPHNYIDIDKYIIMNFYCKDKKQSEAMKKFLSTVDAKYFVSESKTL